jgi:hypothetical protein
LSVFCLPFSYYDILALLATSTSKVLCITDKESSKYTPVAQFILYHSPVMIQTLFDTAKALSYFAHLRIKPIATKLDNAFDNKQE